MRRLLILLALPLAALAQDPDRDPAWIDAHQKPAMTREEAAAFMKTLATFVHDHHLKRTENSPQKGLIYEYFHVARKGQPDQFIQGEALDTMHDGAWFAAAMVNAYRATGDPFYKQMLTQWQLPFYLKMLNHSDELFKNERNDVRPGGESIWTNSPEWLLQPGEKGFVPYWWDDGNSVSLEMINRKDPAHLNFPGRNDLAGKPNPESRLSGYSYGSSNHLAQDLGVMIQQCWLLFRESKDPAEQALAAQLAEAAQNLQNCRANHGSKSIPAVVAPLALIKNDPALRKSLPETTWKSLATARSDYRRAFFDFKPDELVGIPGFADDQQYRYYASIARDGTLTAPAAFHAVYDAFTLPKLYQAYSDDIPAPPGINVFDLHPYKFVKGKPADTRSQRKGPSGRPKPIGSRFGPQNMVVTGWALQALKADPTLWDTAKTHLDAPNYFPAATGSEVVAALEKELGGGLRTWEAIFAAKGYIPTGLGAGGCGAGFAWDELSDTGGYAHLISAASQWIIYLKDQQDWNLAGLP